MALLELPPPDLEQTMLRPIVFDITRDIIEITRLDPDLRILYPGDIGQAAQRDSVITPVTERNTFPYGNQLKVEVTEDFVNSRILNSPHYRAENNLIFQDPKLPVWIRPDTATSEVTINFSARFVDKVSAFKWRDEMKNRVSQGREAMVHSVKFGYYLPDFFKALLMEIHRLREKQAGYGDSLIKYIKDHITSRATVVATQAGTAPEIRIGETQARIQGWFDFDGRPEKGDNSDGLATWTMSFQYTFQYDKVTGLVMGYPLMVHNQLLGRKWRNTKVSEREDLHQLAFPESLDAMREFESYDWIDELNKQNGITIPPFDDFIPEKTSMITDTMKILTMMIGIQPENNGYLVDLKNLGHWNFSSDILEFLKGEAPYLTKPYQSVFFLNLFRRNYMVEPLDRPIKVDSNLNIIADQSKFDLRVPYHLQMNLVTNWNRLSTEAKDRLRENACVLNKIAKAIDAYVNLSFIQPLNGKCGYVPRDQLDRLIEDINRGIIAQGDGQDRQFNTVEFLFIRSFPESKNADNRRS